LFVVTDGPWVEEEDDEVEEVVAGAGALPDFCSKEDIYIKN
jgi:hypothetical protein